jgi:hypothetical protein
MALDSPVELIPSHLNKIVPSYYFRRIHYIVCMCVCVCVCVGGWVGGWVGARALTGCSAEVETRRPPIDTPNKDCSSLLPGFLHY